MLHLLDVFWNGAYIVCALMLISWLFFGFDLFGAFK